MMKNAVVIGATTQVGFALCQHLIDKEVEVTGLIWSEKIDAKSEEMVMEIGRNAFFRMQSDRTITESESVDAVFYCLDEIEKLEEEEQVLYEDFAIHANKLVFISSYRKMSSNDELKQRVMRKVSDSTNRSSYTIYLPMVYGPWQQEEEVVHKRLLEQIEQTESEPIAIKVNDVLFVEDVAEAIYTFVIEEEPGREVLFENDNPKAVEELIRELKLTFLTPVEPEEIKELTKYKVKQRRTTKEGIQVQKDQIYHKMRTD